MSAGTLRDLHQRRPLVLPNVWDAASARAFAAAGFPALATSSGAVANVLGHEDHEQAPVDEVLAAIARITRSVEIPVTAWPRPRSSTVSSRPAPSAATSRTPTTRSAPRVPWPSRPSASAPSSR